MSQSPGPQFPPDDPGEAPESGEHEPSVATGSGGEHLRRGSAEPQPRPDLGQLESGLGEQGAAGR